MKAIYGGNAVELTRNEARILWRLMQKDVCTRDELIEDLWTNGMHDYCQLFYLCVLP